MQKKKVNTALISVSDKSGIIEFAKELSKLKITLFSTGGTAKLLQKAGIQVTEISDYTKFPEIMDGRVKTLHPKVHGGILARREDKKHQHAMKQHGIEALDMVIVNLYPFEKAIVGGGSVEECIENIDIGGPAMIRSAAKNHEDVVVVTDASDYTHVITMLKKHKGATTLAFRKTLAARAFARTADYDGAIANWFSLKKEEEKLPKKITLTLEQKALLRYGENPHQQAALYLDGTNVPGVAMAKQIQGKELSFNNIADADAALELVNEWEGPAVAIVKHANPCGVACGSSLREAYRKALEADPVSAYGSIIAFNQVVDGATAEAVAELFVEVIFAPNADREAKEIFARKKNLRLLLTGEFSMRERLGLQYKSINGGFLVQERDTGRIRKKDVKVVTKHTPNFQEMEEMLFAFTVCKHVKSNAIVLSKDKVTIGIGAGQMSRIDAVRIALLKAENSEREKLGKTIDSRLSGLTLASDAFFPFKDGVELAAKNGVTSIIQPGGSIRDEEVIEAANLHNITMVFTGQRHFKH